MKRSLIGFLPFLPFILLAPSAGFAQDIDRTPRRCVDLSMVNSTRVTDDQTILFYLKGGRILRNSLPRRCPSLAREGRFTYEVAIHQLCNVDIVYVLESWGSGLTRGTGCGLGMFQEISEEDARVLRGIDPRPAEPDPVDEEDD